MKTKAQIIEQVIEEAIKTTVEDQAQVIMMRRGMLKMIDPAKEPTRLKIQQEINNYLMRITIQEEGIEVLKELLQKEKEKEIAYKAEKTKQSQEQMRQKSRGS